MASAGHSHSFFLKKDGSLWGMGANDLGELGDGTDKNRSVPVRVATGVSLISEKAGPWFIKTDGTLWEIVSNFILTKESEDNLSDVYTLVQTRKQRAVDAGYVAALSHAVYVKKDGSAWAQGKNDFGQFGNGYVSERDTPIPVLSDVVAISAGYEHTLSLKQDGSLWGSGSNSNGQLGDGLEENRPHPRQITTGVTHISAGSYHSLFLKADKSLWAMGWNVSGQLGISFSTTEGVNRTVPAQVATNVDAIAAGRMHSLFIKDDKTLWAMGDNRDGQLGLGDNTLRRFGSSRFRVGKG